MVRVSIHQPCYMPYLGVFYKIWQSDIFVYLDDVQYSNGYVFDWNRIKTPQGECRLKIPMQKYFGNLLTEVRPKNFLGWREKHLKTIEMNYKRAPHFAEFFPLVEKNIMGGYPNLAELNIALMEMFIDLFGLREKVLRAKSSEMNIESRAEERVIDIVKKCGGDIYISGAGGRGYQSAEHFKSAGIRLEYADFAPLEYKQQWGGFLPNMSALDYLMNEGTEIDDFFRKTKEAVDDGR